MHGMEFLFSDATLLIGGLKFTALKVREGKPNEVLPFPPRGDVGDGGQASL